MTSNYILNANCLSKVSIFIGPKSCCLCISRRLQNETKFDQGFQSFVKFCFEVKVNFHFSLQDSQRDGTEKSLLGVRVRN